MQYQLHSFDWYRIIRISVVMISLPSWLANLSWLAGWLVWLAVAGWLGWFAALGCWLRWLVGWLRGLAG
jgi:hypothetical protein